MKYTKQQVIDEKISFKPMTKEQYQKLTKHFGYGEKYNSGYYYRFYPGRRSDCGFFATSYLLFKEGDKVKSTKEISFEEFDFEEVPKYWSLRIDDENKAILNDFMIANKHLYRDYTNHWKVTSGYFNFPPASDNRGHSASEPDNEEITTEQFKKYVMNSCDKKIIGYKSPMDLFNGQIPKDTLYILGSSTNITTYCAIKPDGRIFDFGKSDLPKEIVETWEPVYKEEEKIFTVRYKGGKMLVRVSKKGIYYSAESVLFQPSDILNLMNDQIISSKKTSYKVSINPRSITIGCKENIPWEDIEAMIDYYKTL